jgi:hypothetical protein
MLIINCGDKGTSNSDPGKEIARIFFVNEENIDTEEVVGDVDNRITCEQVGSLGPGIRVLITDEDNRSFRLDFEFVSNTGFIFKDGYAEYVNDAGSTYKTTGNALKAVEISWRENLDMCEFTFKAKNPIQLSSQSDIVYIDSLRIETLREDDI